MTDRRRTDFDRQLPPLATLVAFEAAYRHGSFTAAGRELFSSQATISRRVRELEENLGVRLFERNRYDVTPTATAETFATSVRLSLTELATAAERVRRHNDRESEFTLLVSQSLAAATVGPVLAHLQQHHPAVKVRVLSSCEPIDTATDPFDLALQYGTGPSDRHRIEFVTTEAVFPVCGPELAATLPSPLRPEDVDRLPLLHVEYADTGWPTWQTFLASTGGLPENDAANLMGGPLGEGRVDGSMRFSSYEVALDIAEQNRGLALGWEHSVERRLQSGALVRPVGSPAADGAPINAYLPGHTEPHPLAADVLAVLRETLTTRW
ncbi:MAG: LysR substrate-binding domain-containing protein [Actinomycetota bacterium]